MRSIQPAHPTDSVCKFAFVGLPCPFIIPLLSIRLGDELNNATSIRDLLLGLLADVSCADDNGGRGQATLSEELGVSESVEVDERGGVGGRVLQGLLADVGGDQSPQLPSWLISDHLSIAILWLRGTAGSYLVDVDLGLPLVVPQEVESPHTDLTEVTRVVLVKVGSVVVLTTGHTTTTGVLYNSKSEVSVYVLTVVVAEVRLRRNDVRFDRGMGRTFLCLPTRPLPALTWPRCLGFVSKDRSQMENCIGFGTADLARLGESGRHLDWRWVW